MRNVFAFIISVLILLAGQMASAESVIDEAGLLNDMEIELLNQRIHNMEQNHQVRIGVAFVKSIGRRDMITASDDLLDKNYANGTNGGIVLLVAMDKHKYEMSTNSRMMERITDMDGIPFLKDKFKSALSAGNYYEAASNFVDGVDELLTYYETNGVAYGRQPSHENFNPVSSITDTSSTPYEQNSAPVSSIADTSSTPYGQSFDPVAAVIAAVMAILFGIMIRSWLIGSMSNVRHAMAATDYLKKNTVKLTENRDTFLFMNVQRKARSSGGGGRRLGGGGRSGGGGHSSGHGGGGGSF